MNPYFHWCADGWEWVCDCHHCVDPLHTQRRTVEDPWIRSLGYNRIHGILEIEFTSKGDVRQVRPISSVLYRQWLSAQPPKGDTALLYIN